MCLLILATAYLLWSVTCLFWAGVAFRAGSISKHDLGGGAFYLVVGIVYIVMSTGSAH